MPVVEWLHGLYILVRIDFALCDPFTYEVALIVSGRAKLVGDVLFTIYGNGCSPSFGADLSDMEFVGSIFQVFVSSDGNCD